MPITLEPSGNPQVYTLIFPSNQTKFSSDDRQTFLKKLDLEYLLTQNNLTLSIDGEDVEEALRNNSCLKYCCSKSTAADRVFDEIAGLNKQKSNSIGNGEEVKASDMSKLTLILTPKISDTTLEETDNINKTITIETIANSTEEFEITLNYTPPSSEDQALRKYMRAETHHSTRSKLFFHSASSAFALLSVYPLGEAAAAGACYYPWPLYIESEKMTFVILNIIGSIIMNFSLNEFYLFTAFKKIKQYYRITRLQLELDLFPDFSYAPLFFIFLITSGLSALPFFFLSYHVDSEPLLIAVAVLAVFTALHYSGIDFLIMEGYSLISKMVKKYHPYLKNCFRHNSPDSNYQSINNEEEFETASLKKKISCQHIATEALANNSDIESTKDFYDLCANLKSKKLLTVTTCSPKIFGYILYGGVNIFSALIAIWGYFVEVKNSIMRSLKWNSTLASATFIPFAALVFKVAIDITTNEIDALSLTKIKDFCKDCCKDPLTYSLRSVILFLSLYSAGASLKLLPNKNNEFLAWITIFGTLQFNRSAAGAYLTQWSKSPDEIKTESTANAVRGILNFPKLSSKIFTLAKQTRETQPFNSSA
jgi:hypothetical protein